MRIIKNGNPKMRVISNDTPEKISCSECGCVFQYDYYDTHYATSVNDGWEEWIICPWCNAEIYGIFNFEEN